MCSNNDMHKKFNHQEIEKKWQADWNETGIYNVGTRDNTKEKEYVLVEWPYPSGNLHIGHWFAFAVVDIYVRMRRMQGKQVLFPIGFDAFGLPAENAAIKRGLDPKAWTESNMAFMRKQLESMGNAFSWDKTIASTEPSYYAWTQWMFTEFFKNDIAYRGTGLVNWCEGCHTVLANEQVLNGKCERCDTEVTQKEMNEWKLRITKYADKLIDDLDTLEWPEHIKLAQKNWIGRSRGARISFTLTTGDVVDVFTTRPDTLFGATYLVLAPEHTLLKTLKARILNEPDVTSYQHESAKKREEERTALGKEKTGIKLVGIEAVNPATKERVPVYIADYVIASYGTGAVMAVPAHDERDFAFAKKYDLPIRQVIESASELPYTGTGTLINSGNFTGSNSEESKDTITSFCGGEITQTYRLRDWSIGRQRYWGVPIPIVYDPSGKAHSIPKEHLPWHLPTDVDHTPTGEPPLAKSSELKERVERIFGEGWKPDVETMDTFVDSSWYYLRYIDTNNGVSFSDIDAQNDWMPIDLYFGGSEHTTMHLLYSRFWHKVLFDLGLVKDSEPYKKRINRGLVLGPDGNKMSKSKGNIIDPDEQVRNLGADTVKMYLAFMGPYGEMTNYPWDMGGIVGIRRFLERVYGLSEHIHDTEVIETTKLLHKTIAKVTDDISAYKFNTAISTLMVFLNHAEKAGLTSQSYNTFIILIAPFAPHLGEELWHERGNHKSVHLEKWPTAQDEYIKMSEITLPVQVNGKMRGTIVISSDATEEAVTTCVLSTPSLSNKLVDDIERVIYVQGKIINYITRAKT